MNILTFSSLYPNNVDPIHGLFVERRLIELRNASDIRPVVIAPVPWFPFRARVFGRYAEAARIPRFETRAQIEVVHPRFPLIPRVGMTSAAAMMSLACGRCVRKYVRGMSVRLIDAHYFYPDGVAASNIAHKLGIPFFITARGSDINLLANYRSPRRQMLSAARRASAIIAVSEALATRMRELGMPDDRIHVLRNGVDLNFFCPGARRSCGRIGDRDQKIFLSVGALKSAKGHELAIEFVATLPDAKLVIVGQGPDKERLTKIASRCGAGNRIVFTGQLDPVALRDRYRSADCLIHLSEREGMPNVVLESLACGTPVLASDVGGIPELIIEPAAGRLVHSRNVDAVRAAWAEVAAVHHKVAATRAVAEKFSWAGTVDRLARLIHEKCR